MKGLYTRKAYKIIQQCAHDLKFLWDAEPLDGDQTAELSEIFLNELNIENKNIHPDDYEDALKKFNIEYIDPMFRTRPVIGYQVMNKTLDDLPEGMFDHIIYPLDICLERQSENPSKWILCPVREGDIENAIIYDGKNYIEPEGSKEKF
jgi:hypothetical protein